MPKKSSDVAIPLLPFRSLPRLVSFYSKLGFKLLGPGRAPDPYLIATLGTFEIHFWQTKKATVGLAYLRTPSVVRVHKAFSKAAIPSKGQPSMSRIADRRWGMREFSLVDCEGNLLRIGQYT